LRNRPCVWCSQRHHAYWALTLRLHQSEGTSTIHLIAHSFELWWGSCGCWEHRSLPAFREMPRAVCCFVLWSNQGRIQVIWIRYHETTSWPLRPPQISEAPLLCTPHTRWPSEVSSEPADVSCSTPRSNRSRCRVALTRTWYLRFRYELMKSCSRHWRCLPCADWSSPLGV